MVLLSVQLLLLLNRDGFPPSRRGWPFVRIVNSTPRMKAIKQNKYLLEILILCLVIIYCKKRKMFIALNNKPFCRSSNTEVFYSVSTLNLITSLSLKVCGSSCPLYCTVSMFCC